MTEEPYVTNYTPAASGTRTLKAIVYTNDGKQYERQSRITVQSGTTKREPYHGEPIALPIDFLSIAMSELANISERRIYRLVSGTRGLPSFLVANPGVNSGFMITQYTAASVVSLNKSLAMPSSVDSIPSCQDQEDHVSMGANAAIKLYKVILNTERVLAIELFNAAQALDFRLPLKSSPAIAKLHEEYRRVVPFILDDELMYPHIEKTIEFLRR
jgi:histidine ammonia-lyase